MTDTCTQEAARGRPLHVLAARPFAVGFVGRSGSGKTTLASAVLRILAGRGWRVAALKDAHHQIDLDTPGKDTWTYREAGATRVILRTPERWAVMAETPAEPASIDDLLREAGDADFILVEGFKREGRFPKIEVRRSAAASAPPLIREIGQVIAVASDFDEPEFAGLPHLDVNAPEAVADFIEALAKSALPG